MAVESVWRRRIFWCNSNLHSQRPYPGRRTDSSACVPYTSVQSWQETVFVYSRWSFRRNFYGAPSICGRNMFHVLTPKASLLEFLVTLKINQSFLYIKILASSYINHGHKSFYFFLLRIKIESSTLQCELFVNVLTDPSFCHLHVSEISDSLIKWWIGH